MIIRHYRHLRAAQQASINLVTSRSALSKHIAEQRGRWRHRYPWLLPLAFISGMLVTQFSPRQKLWRLAQGLTLVADWVNQRDPIYRRSPP